MEKTRGSKASRVQVALAVVGALGAVAVAMIQFPPWKSEDDTLKNSSLVIAGRVVDSINGQPIRQAEITIAGRTEQYTTEDNGNFRISLIEQTGPDDRVRLYVFKQGYATVDRSISPPAENVIILMRREP